MQFSDWKDAVLVLVGFVLSIGGALIGAKIARAIDRRGEQRPLNQLLNFGGDQLLFIFPHRAEISEAILPRTSTEDFMAMNNFISALLAAGYTRSIGVRDTTRVLPNDRKQNLVIVCSPKSNDFARSFQESLRERHPDAFYFNRDKGTDGEWCICDKDTTIGSPSYKQETEYEAEGVDRRDFPGKIFDDYAVITKVANPWNDRNKVIMIAGIRGIGTWAAAECMKKNWQQLYDQLPAGQKEADFSALLKVKYDNCDITSIDVRRVIPLRERRVGSV